MATWTIIHNPKCSKSRACLQKLKGSSIEPVIRDYLRDPLSKIELVDLLKKLKLPISKIIRVKEELYKTCPFDIEDEQVALSHIEQKPKLLERPIIIKDDVAVIGRPPENIDQLL